jgi:hypothetical protein
VAPGPTRTDAAIDMLGDTVEQMGTPAPLGRAAHPTEIAQAIVFLASPWASYLSGATVPVDGGRWRSERGWNRAKVTAPGDNTAPAERTTTMAEAHNCRCDRKSIRRHWAHVSCSSRERCPGRAQA